MFLMKISNSFILFLLVIITIISGCDRSKKADQKVKVLADAVYKNGKIYTVNEAQPWAEAVAIKDGKFIKVGINKDIAPHIGENTEVIDLEGKFAMPGFSPGVIGANSEGSSGSNSKYWAYPIGTAKNSKQMDKYLIIFNINSPTYD